MHNHIRLLLKLTTRSRPQRCLETLDSIYNNMSSNKNFVVMLSVDSDDLSLTENFIERVGTYPQLLYYTGLSKNKIDAINRDVDKFSYWDVLVNVSDDQKFVIKDFDDSIRYHMHQNFPDTDGVLHLPDNNRKDLMTMSIFGRAYYNQFKYIYHPSYCSLYADDEAQQVAKMLNKYVFVDELLFHHNHPAYDAKYWDKQYEKTEAFGVQQADKMLFEQRKSINFGLLGNDVPINNHTN